MEIIDGHRNVHGFKEVCEVSPIAPSAYHRHKALQTDLSLRSDGTRRDEVLKAEIRLEWKKHLEAYGAENDSRPRNQDGILVAGATVEPLMQEKDLQDITRGPRFRRTTESVIALYNIQLEWAWWFYYHHLFAPSEHVPPVDYEEATYCAQEAQTEPFRIKAAGLR